MVSLLEHILQRPRNDGPGRPEWGERCPDWWRPSSVIGFDLSGNESRTHAKLKPEQLRDHLRPLLRHCAPITIHAGEAASAENIWDAIYLMGARRIGHGLRLREQTDLLDHAITLGICMELCPVSNGLTNELERGLRREGDSRVYDPSNRRHYPLRFYLEKDATVCLNTDNRFLHSDKHTLTDEFIEAACMVGGLTKRQVLQLIWTSFRTSFLEGQQKKSLLTAVDEAIYRILTEEDEELYGPKRKLKQGSIARPATPERSESMLAPQPGTGVIGLTSGCSRGLRTSALRRRRVQPSPKTRR